MFGLNKKTDADKAAIKPGESTLSARLQRTRSGIFGGLFERMESPVIDDSSVAELEEKMIRADVGVKTADQVIRLLTAESNKRSADKACEQLKRVLLSVLRPVEVKLDLPEAGVKPHLLLLVGVNGVGKTTTTGKLAKRLQAAGKRVMLAAGDTFRAAAIEQLQVWGERHQIKVIAQTHGADAGAVIFDALKSARSNNIDVLIADTAGRLHNKANLMQEMKKIHRIGGKFDQNLPCSVLLVLDAGTGQNALVQAKEFNQAIGVDGIILTKLDGTAKGGIVFSLADQLNIPIHFIGVGEQVDDLIPFNAEAFVDALLVSGT